MVPAALLSGAFIAVSTANATTPHSLPPCWHTFSALSPWSSPAPISRLHTSIVTVCFMKEGGSLGPCASWGAMWRRGVDMNVMSPLPPACNQVIVLSITATFYVADNGNTLFEKLQYVGGVFALAAIALSLHDSPCVVGGGGAPSLRLRCARFSCLPPGSCLPPSHPSPFPFPCRSTALMHLLYYAMPTQQRHVVRLLFLVPIYAGV